MSIRSFKSGVSGDDDSEENEEDNGQDRALMNLVQAHTADMQRGRRHVDDLSSEEEGEEGGAGSDEEEAAGEKGDGGSSQSEVYDSAGEEEERTAEEGQMAILVERPMASLVQVGLWLWRVVHWCFF